jgi:hypothetical protein
MSYFNNLDLTIQECSTTPDEYEKNKTLISEYLNGDRSMDSLPDKIKVAITQWEQEAIDFENFGTSPIPDGWEDYG